MTMVLGCTRQIKVEGHGRVDWVEIWANLVDENRTAGRMEEDRDEVESRGERSAAS